MAKAIVQRKISHPEGAEKSKWMTKLKRKIKWLAERQERKIKKTSREGSKDEQKKLLKGRGEEHERGEEKKPEKQRANDSQQREIPGEKKREKKVITGHGPPSPKKRRTKGIDNEECHREEKPHGQKILVPPRGEENYKDLGLGTNTNRCEHRRCLKSKREYLKSQKSKKTRA